MKMILILSNLTMPCVFHFYFFFLFSSKKWQTKKQLEEIRVSDIRRHDKQDLSKNLEILSEFKTFEEKIRFVRDVCT